MKPMVMGILNVTPDSFSDGGLLRNASEAIEVGQRMFADGADWVDVGGESTRPGSKPVSVEEELKRVIPVIEGLALLGLRVSVDTQKPDVARAALVAGATMINDVSGLRDDRIFEVLSEYRPAVCIMHMQGTPDTMQLNPTYSDVVQEILDFLISQARRVESLGLQRNTIFLDPGIGFGKTSIQNASLVRNLHRFVASGFPVMLGVSRKSWVGQIASDPEQAALEVSEREEATLAVQSFAQIAGVSMFRTHNVKDAVRARNALDAILNGSEETERL